MDAVDAGDLLHAEHALVACLVREPWRPDHVADGVEAGHAGAAPFVDDDMALARSSTPCCFEPEPFDIAGDADGEDDAIGGDLFDGAVGLRQRRGDAVATLVKPLDPRAGVDDDALPGEGLAREARRSRRPRREGCGGSISTTVTSAPSAAVEARELDADRAGADDRAAIWESSAAPSPPCRSRSACRRARAPAACAPARRWRR